MNRLFPDALSFFTHHWRTIALLTLLVELPFILLNNLNHLGGALLSPSTMNWLTVGVLVVVNPLSTGIQISAYGKLVTGAPVHVGECMGQTLRHFHALIPASLFHLLSTAIGLLFLIFPGIFLASRLSLFPMFILHEKMDAFDALKQSFETTRGHGLAIGTALLLAVLLLLTLNLPLLVLTPAKGPMAFLFGITMDTLSSVVGSLVLIIPFRVYSLYRQHDGTLPEP